MLTRETLYGVWAGLPVPWDSNDRFDEKTFRTDIESLIKAKVHGIYSAGTTGEFYVQDFDEFCAISTALLDACKQGRMPVQIGCTATSTKEVIKRATFAMKHGADGIQVALPFWMALTDDEVFDFFVDIYSACPDIAIIHYSTDRAKRNISVGLYRRILEKVPTLVGCKFTGADFYEFIRLVKLIPEMSFFIGEHLLASAMMIGGRGSYSSVIYLNPFWILKYYDLCHKRQWEEALVMQEKVVRLFEGFSLLDPGYLDSAVDRCLGRLAGFLKCGLRCRPPYKSVKIEEFDALRKWLQVNLPEFLDLD